MNKLELEYDDLISLISFYSSLENSNDKQKVGTIISEKITQFLIEIETYSNYKKIPKERILSKFNLVQWPPEQEFEHCLDQGGYEDRQIKKEI